MKIKKSVLLDAVKKCCLVAVKKSVPLDILYSNVKLEWKENRLYCSALNDTENLTVSVDCSNDETGKAVVNADRLKKILSKSKAVSVSLSSEPENLCLDFGSIKTKIPLFPVDRFPELSYPNGLNGFYCEPDQIKRLYDRLYSFIGENESRRNLMGLHVKVTGKDAVFMAADAFRLAQDKLEGVGVAEIEGILPKQSFKNVATIFGSSDRGFNFGYDLDSRCFVMFGDGIKYKSKSIDAVYPDLERLLQRPVYQCSVDSKSLVEATEMLVTMIEKDYKYTMKAKFLSETVDFELQRTEFAEGSIQIDGKSNGNDVDMGLNVFIFSQLAAIFKKGDLVVDIGYSEPEKPLMLSCSDFENYKAVLMPVRIQW